MGLFDSNDDFFGGLFDIDGDGKTSLDEELLAYSIFEEMISEDEYDDDDDDDDFLMFNYNAMKDDDAEDNQESDDSWRNDCIVGPDFDVYPELYDNFDDYLWDIDSEINRLLDNRFVFLTCYDSEKE